MKICKLVFPLVIAALVFVGNPIDVRAETYRSVIEDVPEIASKATFVFTFSEYQQYEITLTDPNGEVYNKSEKSGEIKIDVSDSPSGDYSYSIEAENADFTYSVNVLDVGKTIASVGESNPTITENVSNLQIYFVDSDLVATWDYTGNVSITITDPARFNNLESGYKTSATEYRREMPDNVDSVQFYIVPTVDAKVAGAGLTYTRSVIRNIDASVEFPDTPVVNEDIITVPITVKEDSVVLKIYNNNYTVGVSNHNDDALSAVFSDTVSKGSYEIDIPLVALENNLVACIIDEQGNAVTTSYKYIRDMQAPTIDPSKISLDNLAVYTDYTTTSNTVLISGTITDEIATDMLGEVERFTIAGYDVVLDNSGRFSFEHQLVLGNNDILLVATDTSGNQTELMITVTMVEEESSPIGVYLFVGIFIVLFVILIVLVIWKLKETKDKPKNPTPSSPKSKKEKPTREEPTTEIEKHSAMIAKLKASANKQTEDSFFADDETLVDIESNDDEEDYEEVNEMDEIHNNVPLEKKKLAVKPKTGDYKPILKQMEEEESKAKLSFKERRRLKSEEKAVVKQKKKEEKRSRYEKENNVLVENYDDAEIIEDEVIAKKEPSVVTASSGKAFVKKEFSTQSATVVEPVNVPEVIAESEKNQNTFSYTNNSFFSTAKEQGIVQDEEYEDELVGYKESGIEVTYEDDDVSDNFFSKYAPIENAEDSALEEQLVEAAILEEMEEDKKELNLVSANDAISELFAQFESVPLEENVSVATEKSVINDTVAETVAKVEVAEEIPEVSEKLDISESEADDSTVIKNFVSEASRAVAENIIGVESTSIPDMEVYYEDEEDDFFTDEDVMEEASELIQPETTMVEKEIKSKNNVMSAERKFTSPVVLKPKKKVSKKEETAKNGSYQGNKMRNIRTISNLVRYTIQAGCVIVFFTAVIRNTVVVSGSMEPTLKTGEIAIFNKLAYGVTEIQRGDIIDFWCEEQDSYYSKRVIGIGGDTIEFHDGYVFINGHLADESLYLDENVETNCSKTFVVPEGCVFVLGDNRNNSFDSRYFENPYISKKNIEGKYIGSIPKLWD